MTAGPLLLLVGRDLVLETSPKEEPRRFRLSPSGRHEGRELVSALLALARGEAPSTGLGNAAAALSALRGAPVRVGDGASRAIAESFQLTVVEAPSRDVAALRERLPAEQWAPDRELLLLLAEVAVAERLASPEEVIITLSREGDRLERLVRKESEALRALASAAGAETPVADYAARADEHLKGLEVRRAALERALEESVLRTLPNTSAVVGPRTAARLLALAGSTSALARLNASRLQVLGARRHRPGSPGPRHGVVYGAEGMDRVPPARRGALARSLGSWTSVAVRADILTHGSVGSDLAEKREARIVQLAAGRRPPRRPPIAPRGREATLPPHERPDRPREARRPGGPGSWNDRSRRGPRPRWRRSRR